MSRRHFPATNRFVCNGFFCVKIFVSATEFYRRNMSQKIKSDRIFATYCGDKILLRRQRFSQKFSSTHGAICRRNVLLQLVARPVHTEWSVASTCCCNLSPDLYTQSDQWPRLVAATCRSTARSDQSPRLVAATCRPTCTHGVISRLDLLLQLVTQLHGVISRLDLLLQLVARPVHTEWSVASTCCFNLSPDLYTRRDMWPGLSAATCHLVLCTDLKMETHISDRCSYQIAFSVGTNAYTV